ncbi:hypothetical protein M8C21_020650 [Ambrosia artemisiifolia]|uniref:TF-B3 domain-containing protein n=1 Tax=Ambrosia artemisiifolia TaxID=4212 RepID=A0AAD5GNP4_AMBAR|nr:hypothetical protein M8C21_020650 [Ambrosia artemisiifolia]
MVVSKQDYEQLRNQRIEENRRRMEELRLHHLTQALKPPQMKRTQPRLIGTEMVAVRKSNRVANLPARVYKAELIYKAAIVARDSSSKCSRTRSSAMTKAVEVRISLGTEHPSCIMMLKGRQSSLQGHLPCSNSMVFPLWFWKMYLPKADSEMVIEDQNGEIHHVKYYTKSRNFSVGWKKFAVGQNLLLGDVLVFHLVQPYKFKGFSCLANDLKKANDLIARLNLEARMKQMIPETERAKPFSSTMVQKKQRLSNPSSQIISQCMEQSRNNSEELGSAVLQGSRRSKPDLSSQELEAFKDFHIMVKGVSCMIVFPKTFITSMIGETVNIANEIKNCKLTTTKEQIHAWDNSLKSFSHLGMKVEFLRDKIATLSTLVFESENKLDMERYMEATADHKHIEDEIKRLTEELKKLDESSRKIKAIVDDLKQKAGKYEVKFQEEVPLAIFE